MLVCPHCQFENPNTNKFCQECGTSLTQNSCPECSSLVPFDAVQCPECGAITGVIWWAIVLDSTQPDLSLTTAPIYLDAQQRYQLIEPWSANKLTLEKQARVLDRQPFQLSLLEALAEQSVSASTVPATAPPDAETAQEAAQADPMHAIKAVTVPPIAQPYLGLQNRFHQALPALHDAWNRDGQQVLLLEDRTYLPALVDLWLNDEVTLPPLQILHWLYEMVELWDALASWHCQQSVLELDNLRIDEDQTLCLQRLYTSSAEQPFTLQDLGQLWQTLFAQSQRTQLGAITLLLADLEVGRLTTVDEVRSRIEDIAYELQANQSDPEPRLDSDYVASTAPSTDAPAPETTPPADPSYTAPPVAQPSTLPLEDDAVLEENSESDSDDLPTVVLPMQLFNLEDAGKTDIGRQRDHNEDYFGIETQISKLESPSGKTVHVRNLYILCDGMGGHAGGEVASALAVDTLRRFFKEKWQSSPFTNSANQLPGPDVLIEAVQRANKAIFDVNQQNARSGSGRMGTTLVMLLIQDTEIAVAHVGDSRLYRYTRKRGLEQITIDHEVGQREIQRGVDPDIAYARPDAYQLTQALGPRDEHFIKPDVQYIELNEDTLLLLCSDGLTDNDLLETHCKTHIEPLLSSQAHLEYGVGQLIELANEYNGHDNITAIAIRTKVRPNLEHLK